MFSAGSISSAFSDVHFYPDQLSKSSHPISLSLQHLCVFNYHLINCLNLFMKFQFLFSTYRFLACLTQLSSSAFTFSSALQHEGVQLSCDQLCKCFHSFNVFIHCLFIQFHFLFLFSTHKRPAHYWPTRTPHLMVSHPRAHTLTVTAPSLTALPVGAPAATLANPGWGSTVNWR